MSTPTDLHPHTWISLIAQEQWGDLTVTTRVLTAEDGGRFAVTQVPAQTARSIASVVLLPGMFSNRHFWLSARGVGLAGYLARNGFDCWLVERRGLGHSPPPGRARPGLEEHARFDLPLVQRLVQERDGRPAFWMGHSFGGVLLTQALARTLDRTQVAGIVLFAAQFEVGKGGLSWPWGYFTRGLARLCGRFPARRLGMGPENEWPAAMDDACAWTQRAQRVGDIQLPLKTIDAPVLAFAGGADNMDPPEGCVRLLGHLASTDKSYTLLAKSAGFAQDYDHPGIVVSKAARNEVWPRVRDWLEARAPATTSSQARRVGNARDHLRLIKG